LTGIASGQRCAQALRAHSTKPAPTGWATIAKTMSYEERDRDPCGVPESAAAGTRADSFRRPDNDQPTAARFAPCGRGRSALPALETRPPFQRIFSRAADTRLLYSILSPSVSSKVNARADNWFALGKNPAMERPMPGFLRLGTRRSLSLFSPIGAPDQRTAGSIVHRQLCTGAVSIHT
jgi:hypothetical protein